MIDLAVHEGISINIYFFTLFLFVLLNFINVKTKSKKTLSGGWIYILKKSSKLEILSASFTHSLTMIASLKMTQGSDWPQFCTTITNLPVGCAFWDSDECSPSVPCIIFCALLLHGMKPYWDVNFLYQHFHEWHYKIVSKGALICYTATSHKLKWLLIRQLSYPSTFANAWTSTRDLLV